MSRRTLVLTTSYPQQPGDTAGHFVETEVEELRATGEHVTVLAAGGAQASHQGDTFHLGGGELFGSPGAVERLRARRARALWLLIVALRSWRITRRLGPFDRIDAHWLFPFGWPGLLWVRGEAAVVLHGTDARLLLRFPTWLRNHILTRLERRGARLRFVSEALRQELLTGAAWPARLAAYIQAGHVRPAPLRVPSELRRETARAILGWERPERLIVLCSRLIAQKRVSTGLAAACLIPEAVAVVLGEGPERSALEREYPEALFLGELPRASTLVWLAAADLVLHASRLEGAPTVIREARLLGTPVVCCESGDVAGWARHDPDLHCLPDSPPKAVGATQRGSSKQSAEQPTAPGPR